ncbi:MAG TPA: hypothetical protein VF157_01040 [Chloroflexota bacterium]
MKTKEKSYALRIDALLVEPLQKLKKHNRRSLNAEINAALEAWVARSPATDASAANSAEEPKHPSAKSKKQRKKKEAVAVGAAEPESNSA